MHRRSFLTTSAPVAVSTLAGCSNPLSNNDPKANDVPIVDKRAEVVMFDFVVAHPSSDGGGVVSSTRHKVDPGKTTIENVADFGTYDLSIAVDGMPDRSRIWHATDCHHLTITIWADSVKFAEKKC
ncbi:hypothetical protein V5735_10470 (plasmid) [Haladaptatus sp. SPP-AMP-3]|uniref:hypothetical protein n=1 Tax=Haladaptatus sp. SPP-AMP-3 TaxID=3121295 RepID=UPI003C2ACA92